MPHFICTTRKRMALFHHHFHGFLLWTADWCSHDVVGSLSIFSSCNTGRITIKRGPETNLSDARSACEQKKPEAPPPRNGSTSSSTSARSSSGTAVVGDAAGPADADSSSAVVNAADEGAAGSTVRGTRSTNPRRRNQPRVPEIPLYVSPMGQKYHGDPKPLERSDTPTLPHVQNVSPHRLDQWSVCMAWDLAHCSMEIQAM